MPTGPSTLVSPFILSGQPNVTVTSLLTSDDLIGSLRMVGNPDGLGAYDAGDGTMVITMNHEIPATSGILRAHGSVGAFVSKLVVNKTTLVVQSMTDLATTVRLDLDNNGLPDLGTVTTTAFGPLCSADMAAVTAFFDPATGWGTQSRIHLTGEEERDADGGRAFAFVTQGSMAGQAIELPAMGNMSFENLVANPRPQTQTIVMMQDDAQPGQLYLYVGNKQATGTAIERAGLLNGTLGGISVANYAIETDALPPFASASFLPAGMFNALHGSASTMSAGELQALSVEKGVTQFKRPEDGAWDPTNTNRYYFTTTNGIDGPSRLWKLEFYDVADPYAGGQITLVLNGTEGQKMLDNITIGQDGRVYCQEDTGNNARTSKIWVYDPADNSFVVLAEHDPARFTVGGFSFITINDETSGILDVTTILGSSTRQAFLVNSMVHTPGSTEVVESGQLQLIYIDKPADGGAGNDVVNGGSSADSLSGFDGTDTMRGGSANDTLDGGDDDDSLFGGQQNDVLLGGIGGDFQDGETGDDVLWGFFGNDTLLGGDGADVLNGEQDDDLVFGWFGNDTLSGGVGNDSLFGEQGNDVLFGGAGQDSMRGSIGDDLLDGQDDADTLSGGANNDTLLGGAGNDLMLGDLDSDLLYGWSGADTLWGGDGNDTLWGEQDNDTLLGEAGNDVLLGVDGNDVMYGWIGNDTLYGWTGADVLWGEAGNDLVLGEDGDDIFIGGLGRDTMTGGQGVDQFFNANFEIAAGEVDLITDFDAADRYLFQTGAQIQYFNFNAPGYGTGAGIHVQVQGGVFILDVFGANASQLQAQTLFF